MVKVKKESVEIEEKRLAEEQQRKALVEKQRQFNERKENINFYICLHSCTLMSAGKPVQCSERPYRGGRTDNDKGREGPDGTSVIASSRRLSKLMTEGGLRRSDDANSRVKAKFGLLGNATEEQISRSVSVVLSEDLLEPEPEPLYFYEARRRATVNTEAGIIDFASGYILSNRQKLPGRFTVGIDAPFEYIGFGYEWALPTDKRDKVKNVSSEISYDDRDDSVSEVE